MQKIARDGLASPPGVGAILLVVPLVGLYLPIFVFIFSQETILSLMVESWLNKGEIFPVLVEDNLLLRKANN